MRQILGPPSKPDHPHGRGEDAFGLFVRTGCRCSRHPTASHDQDCRSMFARANCSASSAGAKCLLAAVKSGNEGFIQKS